MIKNMLCIALLVLASQVVAAQECVDSDNGAVDSVGNSCVSYTDYPQMCGVDGYHDQNNDNFIAESMCCACGGGTEASVTNCCIEWDSDCYLTASAANNMSPGVDIGGPYIGTQHCDYMDSICSSQYYPRTGDLADSTACQECCQGSDDHKVAWNCPAGTESEATEAPTEPPAVQNQFVPSVGIERRNPSGPNCQSYQWGNGDIYKSNVNDWADCKDLCANAPEAQGFECDAVIYKTSLNRCWLNGPECDMLDIDNLDSDQKSSLYIEYDEATEWCYMPEFDYDYTCSYDFQFAILGGQVSELPDCKAFCALHDDCEYVAYNAAYNCFLMNAGCDSDNQETWRGNTMMDTYKKGSCPVSGCTETEADNYNAAATKDDGSCTYPVPGCTDTGSDNFNAAATQDDGSCTSPTCVDMDDTLGVVGNADYTCNDLMYTTDCKYYDDDDFIAEELCCLCGGGCYDDDSAVAALQGPPTCQGLAAVNPNGGGDCAADHVLGQHCLLSCGNCYPEDEVVETCSTCCSHSECPSDTYCAMGHFEDTGNFYNSCDPGDECGWHDDEVEPCPQDELPSCVNTDNGATDTEGTGCDGYIPEFCNDQFAVYNDDDFDFMSMCCVCGGGTKTIQCADLDKKPCRKEHDDECMWNTVLKQCQSKDWAPVCSDFISNKKHCKRLGKKGYNCKWSSGECQATDAACVAGWIEVEVLKQKDSKTKHKDVETIEDCIAKAEAASKGLIYEPNSKKCLTFATVQDYLPGTSSDTDEVIYFNETC